MAMRQSTGRGLDHLAPTARQGASALIAGQKIGLLGGSFNPAHGGHREISLAALTAFGLDAVWWLVSPGNPLKDPGLYESYDTRWRAALPVAGHERIFLSRFEQARGTRYTIDTIRALKSDYPSTSFLWLMGADSFADFHRWRDWRALGDLIPLGVLNRPGYGAQALSGPAATAFTDHQLDQTHAHAWWQNDPPVWVFIDQTNNPLSSTQIRTRQDTAGATGQEFMATMPPKQRDSVDHLTHFLDYHPALSDFRKDVIDGLGRPTGGQKRLSPKYFYDEAGSKLFTRITQTEDYYPTRTELSIMKAHMPEMAKAIGQGASIFEYGSGASEKITTLIEGLAQMQAYVAMDISKDYLVDSAQTIANCYPALSVSAVCADFNTPLALPDDFYPEIDNWTGYFPGSTLGNFTPDLAADFLTRAHATLGDGAQFLIGIDQIKDEAVLTRAYNDADGITAQFNLNLLTRMQRELGARVAVEDFAHHALYNADENRIEMHLVAQRKTAIVLESREFWFEEGETLLTEFSYKYNGDRLGALLAETPWTLAAQWTDDQGYFAVCLLTS
ncbi:MAG: L-histidine N(alpha)-methyltransferase [Pseudomonadota bacterium]